VAAQIAAHQTREAKLDVSHEEMQPRHQELAERFGNQPTKVVETTERRHEHHVEHEREQADAARRALSFARDRNLEREAVVEERAILRDALQRSLATDISLVRHVPSERSMNGVGVTDVKR